MSSKKIYYRKLDNFCGIEYLTLDHVPMYDDKDLGTVIDMPPEEMEMLAAQAIIRNFLPIRGKEVHLLRSAIGLSLEKFARLFNLSAGTVLSWEKAKDERMSLPNELAVRLCVAEKLLLAIPSDYSKLVHAEAPPKTIVIHAA